jgi:hypothetical protein
MFPPGWKNIDESLFLQVCKGLSGLDVTKAGQTELVKRLTEDQEILERAGIALKRAFDWLSARAGVVHEELLPYALQAALIAIQFDREPETLTLERTVESWFWRTSWSEIFASAAFRDVRAEQDLLTSAIDTGIPIDSWTRDQPLPARFDFRSARVRLFVLRLAIRKDLTDDAGEQVDGASLLKTYGRDALVRLFPVPRGASPELKRLLQGVGNRFLLDPSKEATLRDRLRYGPEIPESALSSQFISKESLAALQNGNIEEFLVRRSQIMEEWDKEQWETEKLSGLFEI